MEYLGNTLLPEFENLYEIIDKQCKELCKAIVKTVLTKMKDMNRFAKTISNLYNILHKFYMLQRPRNFLPPLPDNKFENMLSGHIVKIRASLIEHYDILFNSITCSRTSGTIKRIVPSLMIFYVLTKIMICVIQFNIAQPDDIENNRNTIIPSDFEYIESNMLVMHDKPILQMNVKELLDSVKALQDKWNTLFFHPQLVLYVEMLEYRCSQLLHETWPSDIHNLDCYRSPIIKEKSTNPTPKQEKMENLYMFNDNLLWLFTGIFTQMHIRLSHHNIAEHVECPKKWKANDEQIKTIKKWFIRRAESTFADYITTEFRKNYLKLIIRPGEKEEFLMARPNGVCTEQQIYNHVRGKEATQRIQEFAGARQDKEPLMDDESIYPESPACMASVLLSSFFQGEFSETPWSTYCIFRNEISRRHMEFSYEKGPFLIQSFNFFNVFYKKKIFVTNGFFNAFACFLNIVEHKFHGSIDNGKLLLFPLFENIYGIQKVLSIKEKWTQANLKSCRPTEEKEENQNQQTPTYQKRKVYKIVKEIVL